MEATIILPKTDGVEIKPGIFLIGNLTPRPDLGKTSFSCLANYGGMLVVVELTLSLKHGQTSNEVAKRG
jgi:hypothetical protein